MISSDLVYKRERPLTGVTRAWEGRSLFCGFLDVRN